jgi:hypothetical protein
MWSSDIGVLLVLVPLLMSCGGANHEQIARDRAVVPQEIDIFARKLSTEIDAMAGLDDMRSVSIEVGELLDLIDDVKIKKELQKARKSADAVMDVLDGIDSSTLGESSHNDADQTTKRILDTLAGKVNSLIAGKVNSLIGNAKDEKAKKILKKMMADLEAEIAGLENK